MITVTGSAPDQWGWTNQTTPNGDPVTLSIGSSGLYTLTAGMREDGLRLDRLLLTTDTLPLPSGPVPLETSCTTIDTNPV